MNYYIFRTITRWRSCSSDAS